jgi:iron(III) transport system substrate-binding protein
MAIEKLKLERRKAGTTVREMIKAIGLFTLCQSLLSISAAGGLDAATVAEVTSKVSALNAREKRDFLVNGAQKEGELVYYGTILVNEFTELGKAFSARYPFLNLKHYYAPREGILNRSLTEARAGSHAVDVIQVDSSYGYQLLNENLVHPYAVAGRDRFYDGTYDPSGSWQSMYYLTTALIYNTTLVKPEAVPQTYESLLDPVWKGKLLFDPEAGYILAALEQAWGREKAVDYLTRLRKQDLSFRRGGALTTQVVSSGEYPIGIAINGETSAAIRDKGAPLGFKVLSPKIVKPEGLFLAKNSPHPHATLLFADWILSEEGQTVLAGKLGKGTAMKGVRSKYQEFQVQPDYVVSPKLGPQLKSYIEDFAKIVGAR